MASSNSGNGRNYCNLPNGGITCTPVTIFLLPPLCSDGHICRWDLSNNKLVARSETYGPLNCFHVNTEKGIIFTGGEDSFHIWTWNLERKVSIPIEGSGRRLPAQGGGVVVVAVVVACW